MGGRENPSELGRHASSSGDQKDVDLVESQSQKNFVRVSSGFMCGWSLAEVVRTTPNFHHLADGRRVPTDKHPIMSAQEVEQFLAEKKAEADRAKASRLLLEVARQQMQFWGQITNMMRPPSSSVQPVSIEAFANAWDLFKKTPNDDKKVGELLRLGMGYDPDLLRHKFVEELCSKDYQARAALHNIPKDPA